MEASGYQAKKHGVYPEGARLLVKVYVGLHVCVCICGQSGMHVFKHMCERR